ncbi:hypothetical protein GQ54DRAFT_249261, partial [Martensiomyces pterosporus]
TSSTLQVIPDSPDILLYGSSSESRSTILSGRIVLHSRSAPRIKSLTVTLRSQRERLFQSSSSLAPPTHLSTAVVENGLSNTASLPTPYDKVRGQQEWRFSIYVPGSLSETVFTAPAFVAYELIAELHYASAFYLTLASKPVSVAVKRVPLVDSAWAVIASEPMNVSAMWRGRVELTALTRSRIVHDGDAVKVEGVVRPLVKGMRLLRVGFQIREYVECTREVTGPSLCLGALDGVELAVGLPASATECHDASGGLLIDQEIAASSRLSIPQAYRAIQYDVAQGPVKVTHDLVFAASVVDETGQVHNVRLSSGIFVLPLGVPETDDVLPRYEDVGSDTLL